MRILKPTYLAFLAIAFVHIWHMSGIRDPHITSWDNFGYYTVLPQTFINGDPGNAHMDKVAGMAKKYDLSPTLYQFHRVQNGNNISQYPLGMAVFYAPAFITGHIIAKVSGFEADGYSAPYQYSLIWFEVLYSLVAFVFLRKIFLRFFSEWISCALMLICFFGTNYYISVTGAMGMPHQYLFLAYVLLIWCTIKWTAEPTKKHAFFIGLLLGLMAITRPTDVLAFFIPLLWGVNNGAQFKARLYMVFKTHRSQLFILCLGALLFVGIQMMYWKMYAGEWVHYSYKNQREIFEFLHPSTVDFLFGFRKGWFLYTPVMLVAVIGVIYAWRKKAEFGLAFFVFTLITVYVLSSWSCWWYATSFGQRAMVQSYPVYLLGLGFLLNFLFTHRYVMGWIVSFFIFCFVLLNQFQTWQVNRTILRLDRMTKDFYTNAFLRTDPAWGVDTLLMINHDITLSNELPRKWRYEPVAIHKPGRKPDSANVYFVKHTQYPNLEVKFQVPDMKNEIHAWYKVVFEYKFPNVSDTSKCNLIESMIDHHEMGYAWQAFLFTGQSKPLKDGWHRFENYYLTPTRVFEGDKFFAAIDYLGSGMVLVRKLSVEVYNEKPGL